MYNVLLGSRARESAIWGLETGLDYNTDGEKLTFAIWRFFLFLLPVRHKFEVGVFDVWPFHAKSMQRKSSTQGDTKSLSHWRNTTRHTQYDDYIPLSFFPLRENYQEMRKMAQVWKDCVAPRNIHRGVSPGVEWVVLRQFESRLCRTVFSSIFGKEAEWQEMHSSRLWDVIYDAGVPIKVSQPLPIRYRAITVYRLARSDPSD